MKETKAKYVDYRLVPNSTDEAAVLEALKSVSPKFATDGIAVYGTFELTTDPRESILAISRAFNITVRRLEWGVADAGYIAADAEDEFAK